MLSTAYPSVHIQRAGELLVLWLDAFENVPDDVMMTAIRLTLQRCKYWPTIADINTSIKELHETIKPKKIKQLPPDVDRTDKRVKYLLDAVHDGRAAEYIQTFEIEPEVMNIAKSYFPEISEATVRKNYPEIYTLLEQKTMCHGCFGVDACPNGGYMLMPKMMQTGWIKNEVRRCEK